ncbi:MAG: hypothetical protein ACI382_05300, partial [Alloprevotella sp.]
PPAHGASGKSRNKGRELVFFSFSHSNNATKLRHYLENLCTFAPQPSEKKASTASYQPKTPR